MFTFSGCSPVSYIYVLLWHIYMFTCSPVHLWQHTYICLPSQVVMRDKGDRSSGGNSQNRQSLQVTIWQFDNLVMWQLRIAIKYLVYMIQSVCITLMAFSAFSCRLQRHQCDRLEGRDRSLRATKARATATCTAATTTSTTARPATSTAAATTLPTRVLRATQAPIAEEIQAVYTGGRWYTVYAQNDGNNYNARIIAIIAMMAKLWRE